MTFTKNIICKFYLLSNVSRRAQDMFSSVTHTAVCVSPYVEDACIIVVMWIQLPSLCVPPYVEDACHRCDVDTVAFSVCISLCGECMSSLWYGYSSLLCVYLLMWRMHVIVVMWIQLPSLCVPPYVEDACHRCDVDTVAFSMYVYLLLWRMWVMCMSVPLSQYWHHQFTASVCDDISLMWRTGMSSVVHQSEMTVPFSMYTGISFYAQDVCDVDIVPFSQHWTSPAQHQSEVIFHPLNSGHHQHSTSQRWYSILSRRTSPAQKQSEVILHPSLPDCYVAMRSLSS